ncbi:MAG: DUF1365 domain-containing protein [Betaproteobacteria bacterium]|nr:DUF1365 domain-containing protein [Betaproteobacteria bacterium]
MHSAIYRGWLRHRRFAPSAHAFRYPLFMMYLDLAELDQVFRGRWLWSARRAALARFDRADHLGDPNVPLDHAVRDLIARESGRRPSGPIRLLTHLRYFGYGFNPVSFYFCFDATGTTVECIVAEVNNTPWGERHCYVLRDPLRGVAGHYQTYDSIKVFHVSPFMPMALNYTWGFSMPGDVLNVHMSLRAQDDAPKVFDATLRLQREPVTGTNLARVLLRFPLMSAQVIAAIHWQALRLWVKRVPLYTHPGKPPRGKAAPGANANTTPEKHA